MSISVPLLDTSTFLVVVVSGTTLSYQWFKDGNSIPGATSASYTILHTQATDQGTYAVKVTNAGGTVTSSNATLTVLAPPAITTQPEPQSQTVMAGQSATFKVSATGTGPLAYQWMRNGAPLGGATNASFTINAVRTNYAGTYTVVITNGFGSVTSTPALLTVTNPVVTLSTGSSSSLTPGGFTFQLDVPAGATYVVLASTDLQHWIPIATNVAASASSAITDASAANYPSRYYRAMIQ